MDSIESGYAQEDRALEGNIGMPGVEVRGISELVLEQEMAEDADLKAEAEKEKMRFDSTLEGRINQVYETNKRAREESGIEEEMINSLYQVNGEYSPDELSRLGNGSRIWMNLTATKSRAGRSWIKDILQPANAWPMEIRHTPVQELPVNIKESIMEAFKSDASKVEQRIAEKYAKMDEPEEQPVQQEAPGAQQDPTAPQQEQAPAPEPPKPSALVASRQLREVAELKRDIDEAILEEVNKVSAQQCKTVQRYIMDDLLEGSWNQAFSAFIDDFTIYPTAFLKGPIVTTKKRLTYRGGVPFEVRDIGYENKRVCPLDIYPSPAAEAVTDGDFIEHIRLTRSDLSDLAHIEPGKGYNIDNILEVLEQEPAALAGANDQKIEEAKARLEKRGSQTAANTGIYHGYHYWGTAKVSLLLDWGIPVQQVEMLQMWEEVEIEAISVNHKVIKCCINKDPLGRRPYYAASYQNRSGSLWGRSLPYLMRSEQRMCNATARSLADNMGFSSGPQCAILVDRLADDGDISDNAPKKVWQFTSDPQGNGGKPIDFFIVPSNATELIGVYDKFEMKADDATGIPRYSYGNEQVGGAGQTLGGLSILMESATKGVKDAIRNISEGVIIPRTEYQFYLHLLRRVERNDPLDYHGDVNVVVFAAEAITLKAAEQEKQRELLAATANEFDMSIIGKTGRADMLRVALKDANFDESIIPSRLDIKITEEDAKAEAEEQQQQAQAAQQQGANVGLEATKLQVDAQTGMHKETQAVKREQLQMQSKEKATDQQLKAVELDQKAQAASDKLLSDKEVKTEKLVSDQQSLNKKLAVEVSKSKTNSQETPI